METIKDQITLLKMFADDMNHLPVKPLLEVAAENLRRLSSGSITYRICIGHAWLGNSGWSGYYKRLDLYHKGQIKHDEIYGEEQCREHIKEYLSIQNDYTKQQSKEFITIEKITTIIEIVK